MSFWVHGNHPIGPLEISPVRRTSKTYLTTGGAQEGSSSSYKQMYFTIVLQALPQLHPKIVDQLQRGKKKIWFFWIKVIQKKPEKSDWKNLTYWSLKIWHFQWWDQKGVLLTMMNFPLSVLIIVITISIFKSTVVIIPMIMWTLVSLLLLLFLIRITYSHYITIRYCYYHY